MVGGRQGRSGSGYLGGEGVGGQQSQERTGDDVIYTLPQCRRPWLNPWVGKIPWRRDRLPTPVFLGFPCDSAGKESTCNAGDLGSIPGSGRSPGEGNSYPLPYSGLENSMDCIGHGVSKSRTRLSDLHFHFHMGRWEVEPPSGKLLPAVWEDGVEQTGGRTGVRMLSQLA